MQVTGTKAAFIALVSQRGFAAKSGIDKALVSLWKNGKRVPTLDKMEEVLLAHGASVLQEKVWEVVTPSDLEKMLLFEKDLYSKRIGDSIAVNYLDAIDRIPIRNMVNRYAGDINAEVAVNRPDEFTEIFTFIGRD